MTLPLTVGVLSGRVMASTNTALLANFSSPSPVFSGSLDAPSGVTSDFNCDIFNYDPFLVTFFNEAAEIIPKTMCTLGNITYVLVLLPHALFIINTAFLYLTYYIQLIAHLRL